MDTATEFTGKSIIVTGAVAKLMKDGSSAQIGSYYANQYIGLVNLLRSGMQQLPEIQELHQMRG